MSIYFNKSSGRYNTYLTAKKAGLFDAPHNFELPKNIGLDIVNKRAVSAKTLKSKVSNSILSFDNIYRPGYVHLPISGRLLKRNKTTKVQAKQEVKEYKKLQPKPIKFTTTQESFKQVGNNFTVTPVGSKYVDILEFQ